MRNTLPLVSSVSGLLAIVACQSACNEGFIDPTDVVVHEVTVDIAMPDGETDASTGGGPCQVVVAHDPDGPANRVTVAGGWNGFSATADAMTRGEDGVWRVELSLSPGEYPFKFVIDGTFEQQPPASVPTHWVDGIENRNLMVADCRKPILTLTNPVVTPPVNGMATISGRLCAEPSPGQAAVSPESLVVTVGAAAAAIAREPVSGDGSHCIGFLAERPVGKHSLRATVENTDGVRGEIFAPIWVEQQRFDWRDALLYMLMVDRFIDSDGVAAPTPDVPEIANHIGGDFAGVSARIDDGHFAALGVNAIWLAPVQQNADGAWLGLDNVNRYTGYHGYWPVDPFAIEDRFAEVSAASPENAFDALVANAHRNGIRIVLDVVLNHVHENHRYCNDFPGMCKRTCVCGQADCSWDTQALECQFADYLPDLDYRDHGTLMRVLDDVVAFVKRHDIDALRVDAVKHIDRAAITNLRARIDAIDDRFGPFWLVGETFTGGGGRGELMTTIGPGALDGQFDFPLYWAIRDTFVHGAPFTALEAAISASETIYGTALPLMSPFAGNHDVDRLATALADNDLGPFGDTPDVLNTSGDAPDRWDIINPLSMALAFTMSLQGIPLLYAGDEVGLGGSGDPDNRRMFPVALSADRAEVLRRVREIGQLRQQEPVLRHGSRREVWMNEDILVQARTMATPGGNAARVVLIAMNRGVARTIEVDLPPDIAALVPTRATSLLSDKAITVVDGRVRLVLDPWEYLFVRLD